jgi:hypothetical protein
MQSKKHNQVMQSVENGKVWDYYVGYPPLDFGPRFPTLDEALEYLEFYFHLDKPLQVHLDDYCTSTYLVHVPSASDEPEPRRAYIHRTERIGSVHLPYGAHHLGGRLMMWRHGWPDAEPLSF